MHGIIKFTCERFCHIFLFFYTNTNARDDQVHLQWNFPYSIDTKIDDFKFHVLDRMNWRQNCHGNEMSLKKFSGSSDDKILC